MVTTLRQAAALADEALQRLTDVQQEIEAALAEPNKCTHGVTDGNCKECYMAEPEQEPVAWWHQKSDTFTSGNLISNFDEWTPLYTTPPQRKPLTHVEIIAVAKQTDSAEPECWCHKCNKNRLVNNIPFSMTRMIVCPSCGNKRCPKASDHLLDCTGSNETGQPGSVYPAPPNDTP